MNNGLGVPQTIVLFGGTSEIGLAILNRLVRPGVSRIVMVSRDVDAANISAQHVVARHPEIDCLHVAYDASDTGSVLRCMDDVVSKAGDIDLAVIAQGVLSQSDPYEKPLDILPMIQVNFSSAMVLMYLLAARMRQQGYGKIVLLSSVAGERVRKSNAAYGATKAGIDSFALALDHDLEGSGASVLVVRPGFVETRMTSGMKKAPFSVDAETVARAVERGMTRNSRVIWVPGLLRWVFLVFRHLPTSLWRRLPL